MNNEISNKRTTINGDWVIEEFVSKKTHLSRYTRYFFKRKRAPRVEIRNRLAQQLAGYSLIEKDLRNILSWLEEIENLFPHEERLQQNVISEDRALFNVIKGLFVASIVFYGKCFTQCEGRKIKLDKNFIDEEFYDVHDNIMNARHNYAAHSGADKYEEVKVALVLNPKNKNAIPILFKELTQADMIIDEQGQNTFKDLVEHIKDKVCKKIELLDSKIIETVVFPLGNDFWYKLAKKNKSYS